MHLIVRYSPVCFMDLPTYHLKTFDIYYVPIDWKMRHHGQEFHHFISTICNQWLNDDDIMASFYVVALFTHVPNFGHWGCRRTTLAGPTLQEHVQRWDLPPTRCLPSVQTCISKASQLCYGVEEKLLTSTPPKICWRYVEVTLAVFDKAEFGSF